jgi:hypothetical protein
MADTSTRRKSLTFKSRDNNSRRRKTPPTLTPPRCPENAVFLQEYLTPSKIGGMQVWEPQSLERSPPTMWQSPVRQHPIAPLENTSASSTTSLASLASHATPSGTNEVYLHACPPPPPFRPSSNSNHIIFTAASPVRANCKLGLTLMLLGQPAQFDCNPNPNPTTSSHVRKTKYLFQ